MKNGVTVVKDNVRKTMDSLRLLATTRVMVGIPSTTAGREDQDTPITNAELGYIHENGAPEANIPARPFLVPGVTKVQDQTISSLEKATQAALAGNPTLAEQHMNAAGMRAAMSVKATITAGIAPPLADSTVRARAAKGRKGAVKELERRAQGQAPGTDLVKPLIDTGQLRNAVTYVLRKVR